jgi:glycosyltransferase involved in cell wall biosynthesis
MADAARRPGPDETTPPRPRTSGIVACFNEEEHIGGCLASLSWCDEVIVVDSFSADRTAEIARGFPNVRFFQRTYYGDGSQRNWAMNQATGDWLFVLDADERCPPPLRDEIDALLRSAPAANAFAIPRRNYFLGKPIRFSGRRHDQVVRLARRGLGYYSNRRVHAGIQTVGAVPVLRCAIDHYIIECFHRYVQRVNLYGYWGAAQAWRDGTRSSLYQLLVRPGFRFIRTYLLQLGFLDGKRGLTFCALQAYASYLKWSLLWSWRVNAARGRAPPLPEFDEDPAVWRGVAKLRSIDARAASPAPPPLRHGPEPEPRGAADATTA